MTRARKTTPVVFQGLEAGLRMFRWVVVGLLVLFCFSGVTKVRPSNVGLLLRFGKLWGATRADQIKEPGLVLALPYPIDELIQVPVKQEPEVVVDEAWKELTDTATTDTIDPVLEGYCLTGDHNVIQAKMVVKYKITDPIAYQLSVTETGGESDRDAILRDVTLASLTQTVASWNVDDALKKQRPHPRIAGETESLANAVMRETQRRVDALGEQNGFPGCGLKISSVEFREFHPPRHVKVHFDRVQSENIAAQTEQRRAESFRNQLIPAAETQRNQMIQGAKAYQSSLTGQATAEVEEFRKIYIEYRKAPRLVWQRLYMDTVEHVLANVGNRIFVPPETGGGVILPGEAQP